MEKLITIQTKEKLNEVYSAGEKGPGGGCHEYFIVAADGEYILEHIQFQKGPRQSQGSVPGVLDCDLLEIVRDRMKAFQSGTMATDYNAQAFAHVEEALKIMNRRVEDRIKRGVLGTMEK